MKRIMDEAAAQHVEVIHYSWSVGIRVGGDKCVRIGNDTKFWLVVLEGFSRKKLSKEEADRVERWIREVTVWNDRMEEKTNFVEAAC
mgnify:CR=1 FL=1